MARATAPRSTHVRAPGGQASPSLVRLGCLPHLLATNPYQRLLYEQLGRFGFELVPEARLQLGWLWRQRGRVSVLHMHWPESYYRQGRGRLGGTLGWLRVLLLGARLGAARMLGYRIVWTVHQLYPHERAAGRGEGLRDRLAARLLTRLSGLMIVHDAGTRESVIATLPRARRKLAVVPHGSYTGVYPAGRPSELVRRELGISPRSFVFLCFGLVRAYKHLDLLLDAFGSADLPDASLLVAGLVVDAEAATRAREAAAADARIKLRLGFVPDEDVAELFGASDVAVFARSDGGTSGALILSLSLGCPAIAARTPAYERLLGGEAAGWLFEPGAADSLEATLVRAARDPAAGAKREQAFARAEQLRWPEIGDRTASLIRSTLRGGRAPHV